jgi:hypothetical protein
MMAIGQQAMKTALIQLAAVVSASVAICVQSCSADQASLATDAEVATGLMHLEIREHPGFVEVSGENPNSGLKISKVTIKRHKHDLVMKVHFILFDSLHPLSSKSKPGTGVTAGGLSHYKIFLSPNINRILAGKNKRVVIWERYRQPLPTQ